MNTTIRNTGLLALFAAGIAGFEPASAQAQQEATSSEQPATFEGAAEGVRQELAHSVAELDQLRASMAEEKLPLSGRLTDLTGELSTVRQQFQQTTRLLDSRTLDLTNLRGEIAARREEATYLSNLMGEYARNLEAGLHIAEVQRYQEAIDASKLALENGNLPQEELYSTQVALLTRSLERLQEAVGGAHFEGRAVDAGGLVVRGDFVLVGPAAFFRSADGSQVGAVEQRLGSLEPSLVAYGRPEDAAAASALIAGSAGFMPLDPTLGNAHKIETTEESLWEHIQKGGVVMVPIFVLAGAALLVAIFKWISLLFVRTLSSRRFAELLAAVAGHDDAGVEAAVARIRGPVGRMLRAGVAERAAPRELLEEVMYETVLTTRLKLERLLPFIAISAASAPLLGLLGTVTGIINTFKLITVFGSGDVKTLSGGISEALITTEFGLIVAIPSLLLHAFLSRKARGVINQMETAAVRFVNQVSKSRGAADDHGDRVTRGGPDPDVLLPTERGGRPQPQAEPVGMSGEALRGSRR